MSKLLTEDAVARYRRDGVHWPVPVLTADEVAHYRGCLEAFERSQGGPLRGSMMFKTHLLFTWVDRLIRTPKVLDAVEDILGPDLLAWNTHWFIKEPGDGRYVAWHQDTTYWHLEPDDAVTVWIALSPATKESGAMRMVPGTHTSDVAPHVDTWKPGAMLTRGQEIAVEVDEASAVDVELRPGEMSLHHHRQVAVSADSAALVRGVDRHGHFQPEPRPERDMDPALVAMQAEAAQRQASILYAGTGRPTFRADL